MLNRIRTFAFLALLSCLPLAAFAQTYPSQPTFLKCGVGIGPNTAEVQAAWGGPTPLGSCWFGTTTAGDGGFIGWLVRETGVDPTTNQWYSGVGTSGGRGTFYIRAPWGNDFEIFANAGGASGVLALGLNGDITELRSDTVRISSQAPDFRLIDLNSALNETIAQFSHDGGLFAIKSLTDLSGAGQTLFSADRSGVNWQNVALTAQLGSLVLTGQSQATLTSSVSTTVSASTGDINVTGNTSSQTIIGGSGTLQLATATGAGKRILFADNGSEALDYDIRGGIGNTAGDLNIVTRIASGSGIRTNTGSDVTPSHSFTADTGTGLYSAGAGQLGFSTSGAVSAVLTGDSFRKVGSCNDNFNPCFAFNVDPDTGFYRSGNNVVGLVAGGVEAFKCSATLCTSNVALTAAAGFTGAGTAYGCQIDIAATAERCPTGWTAVSNGGGDYTVTHNLGLANALDLAVSVTPLATVSNACRVDPSNITVNAFHYTCYTSSTGGAADTAAMLTAVRIN